MCGIFCIFSTCQDYNVLLNKCKLCEYYIKHRGPDDYSEKQIEFLNYKFIFAASVLWLQGKELIKQPIVNDKSVFAFNGDIFGGDISDEDRKVHGDTLLLLTKLENSTCIIESLSRVQGPYAFIYLDKVNLKLYFGRDLYGRRSLLIARTPNEFVLLSVAPKDISCIELPAIGIFSYDFIKNTLVLMPWKFRNNNFSAKLSELKEFLCCNIEIDEQLELLTYTIFKEPSKIDLDIFEQIKLLSLDKAFEVLLNNSIFLNNVKTLKTLLENSISKRISTQPKYCKLCMLNKNICNHALVAVLFSGGLDCTVLALLAHKYTDPQRAIDLINVAFEKGVDYNTPDRKTGLHSFQELKKLCPNRNWNFVEINVTTKELDDERNKHIRHLIHPLNSILDDSLGCALWFASRGCNDTYEVSSRVLLVGMGADELFGGYTRHRAALKKHGWLGLHSILNEDWQNISHRNLARDDRVISDHGRQLRTPYLDENLVEFVRNLDCWQKTCPSEELQAGLGDKILLRTLAYHLGLRNASTFKKRALQFGSRIANSKENAHDVSPRL